MNKRDRECMNKQILVLKTHLKEVKREKRNSHDRQTLGICVGCCCYFEYKTIVEFSMRKERAAWDEEKGE